MDKWITIVLFGVITVSTSYLVGYNVGLNSSRVECNNIKLSQRLNINPSEYVEHKVESEHVRYITKHKIILKYIQELPKDKQCYILSDGCYVESELHNKRKTENE